MEIVEMVEIRLIQPNPNWIRSELGEINELVYSIRANGLLQPIILRPRGKYFEIIVGHRRLEACRKLHWFGIPAIVKEVTDKTAFELSLVENLQRNNLSILEEAKAYQTYTTELGWGGVSEVATKIGKSPAYVSHVMSLLKLPPKIQEKLRKKEIGRSAAQELLWVRDENAQMKLAEISSGSQMTVKELRNVAKELSEESLDDADEGPFATNWIRESSPKTDVILEKVATSFRIALIRLDSLIERTDDRDVKNFLIQKRYALHKLIDEVLSQRKLRTIA
jgi:ParB family transcriptional regulator, chromosome partitioning protein